MFKSEKQCYIISKTSKSILHHNTLVHLHLSRKESFISFMFIKKTKSTDKRNTKHSKPITLFNMSSTLKCISSKTLFPYRKK